MMAQEPVGRRVFEMCVDSSLCDFADGMSPLALWCCARSGGDRAGELSAHRFFEFGACDAEESPGYRRDANGSGLCWTTDRARRTRPRITSRGRHLRGKGLGPAAEATPGLFFFLPGFDRCR